MALDVSGNALPPSLLSKINERCEAAAILPPLPSEASSSSAAAAVAAHAALLAAQGVGDTFRPGAMILPSLLPVSLLTASDGGDEGAGESGKLLLPAHPLPPLRPIVRMPQSRHVFIAEEAGDGVGGRETRTKVRLDRCIDRVFKYADG